MENDAPISDQHRELRKRELQILNIVKDCLVKFGTIEDVIFQLRRFAQGEAPECPGPKSFSDLWLEQEGRRKRGELTRSEIAERDRIMRAAEVLINHAIDFNDWKRVIRVANILTELRETAYCNYPVENIWDDELEKAWLLV
jgi:hypothetical protein